MGSEGHIECKTPKSPKVRPGLYRSGLPTAPKSKRKCQNKNEIHPCATPYPQKCLARLGRAVGVFGLIRMLFVLCGWIRGALGARYKESRARRSSSKRHPTPRRASTTCLSLPPSSLIEKPSPSDGHHSKAWMPRHLDRLRRTPSRAGLCHRTRQLFGPPRGF